MCNISDSCIIYVQYKTCNMYSIRAMQRADMYTYIAHPHVCKYADTYIRTQTHVRTCMHIRTYTHTAQTTRILSRCIRIYCKMCNKYYIYQDIYFSIYRNSYFRILRWYIHVYQKTCVMSSVYTHTYKYIIHE